LSVTAKDADIRVLVETISAKSGVEIVLDKTITGKVTVEFPGMKFEEGLKRALRDIVEGGFAAEYVKKNNEQGEPTIRKVTIARVGKEASERKDMLRITEITVQEVTGKEIVFAKWGDGENEIALKTSMLNCIMVRQGFSRMRVGDDGTIYFASWPHQKVFVYDKDGNPKKPIEFSLQGHGFDVDHEGNVYVFLDNFSGGREGGQIQVYGSDGSLRDKFKISKSQLNFTEDAVIEDGVMNDSHALKDIRGSQAGFDLRKYLRSPDTHSSRKRDAPRLRQTVHLTSESDPTLGWNYRLEWTKSLGIVEDSIDVKYPAEWQPCDDWAKPIGIDNKRRLYNLVSNDAGRGRFRNDYAVMVLDPSGKSASYYRLQEVDSFIYEIDLRQNYRYVDMDTNGNVYLLFTTRAGVHVYKYDMGVVK